MVDRIPLTTGLAHQPCGSRSDRKKIYVTTNDHSGMEVIDVATRKVINHFVLNTPTKHYRFNGGAPDPTCESSSIRPPRKSTSRADRYEIGKPKYTVIDLAQQKIVKTVDIAKEDENAGGGGGRGRGGFEVSPDGKYLYQFRDRVVILNTDGFKVVDRIELSKPDLPGMEQVGFGGLLDSIGEPGQHISLFNSSDPIVHNHVFGIARFDLASRHVRTFNADRPRPRRNGRPAGHAR